MPKATPSRVQSPRKFESASDPLFLRALDQFIEHMMRFADRTLKKKTPRTEPRSLPKSAGKYPFRTTDRILQP